ncbi:MAG: M23 family metallopeptidase [Spirochaetales bacterium]|uniref:M23 family metallopeptidase n=1 Tax=Candidatus Thalassospirochaeta sargassi TaxID=3119039 RepID=A0AAJ1IA26_9SPIO|nr:M23 family metallopeptidase [Spirochaetales bacterium]
MADKSNFTSNIIKRIAIVAQEWLGSSRSYSSPVIDFRAKRRNGLFFIVVTRVNERNLHIQEVLTSSDGINRIFRNWTFKKDDEWQVLSLEKDGKQIILADLPEELAELHAGIDTVFEKTNNSNLYFNEEVLSVDYNASYAGFIKPKGPVRRVISALYHEVVLHPSVFVPVLTAAVVVLAIFVAAYFLQVNRIQHDLGSTMDEYLLQIQGQVQNLDTFMVEAEGDLEVLKENLERSKTDFEFNRHNAYANVMRLSEELTKYLPARKEAYKLIASNIQEAVSYGEIIYEMSQLPSEEYQARIFLATEEQRVIPLSRYIPAFSNMVYPVAITGRENDGRGFRITDGYMEKRQDPLGSGGVAPHYAVDIINVGNIDFISYAGEIIREGMPAGDVTASYEGVVKEITHDEEQYGWTIEVEHALTKEVKTLYPDAESWTTFYAHLHEAPLRNPQDWVNTGEKLGLIGNTGKSTGPHLHFEVRVYRPGGMYWAESGERFDKINPFPPENKKTS